LSSNCSQTEQRQAGICRLQLFEPPLRLGLSFGMMALHSYDELPDFPHLIITRSREERCRVVSKKKFRLLVSTYIQVKRKGGAVKPSRC